ncbi:MAG: hypothetical protein WD397_15560 [Wenzhouxiangellaceae bacterium]
MSARELVGVTAVIGYYAASVLGHLEVSLWLVQRRESDLLGSYRLAEFLPHAGALLLAAVVIWQARRARHGTNRAATLAAWATWLVAAVLVDRFLIYSFAEYLHYPQYALLAWMLARLHDPNRTAFAVGPVLLAVTVLGIADEVLQYTWITVSYSNYLDFNDFLLNLLGGAAGLLLYFGFAPGQPAQSRDSASAGATPSSRKRCAKRGVIRDLDNLPMSALGRGGVPDDSRAGRPGQTTSRHPRPYQFSGLRFANPTCETGSRIKPAMTLIQRSARYGLVGFAWLGTAMLLGVAALNVTSPDPTRLQPIERQPSYNTWIPGPHAGRYYVLDPVTGTLLLAGMGALASAAPIVRWRNKQSQVRTQSRQWVQ